MQKVLGIIMVATMVLVGYTNTAEAGKFDQQEKIFEQLKDTPEPVEFIIMCLVANAYENKNIVLYKIFSEELAGYRERKRIRSAAEAEHLSKVLAKVQANHLDKPY